MANQGPSAMCVTQTTSAGREYKVRAGRRLGQQFSAHVRRMSVPLTRPVPLRSQRRASQVKDMAEADFGCVGLLPVVRGRRDGTPWAAGGP